ncbi:MAG TPA: CPBP family intramembrane glutamic endopeptidase [Terriglobales bacterium]|nr:CPBP family intramembrane glutamic endopeptidase [Terriglobales bacterium]
MPPPQSSSIPARSPAQQPSFRARFLQSWSVFAVQIAVGFALIEAALWEGRHIAPWAWLALAWIVACTLASGFSCRELGLGGRGLRTALWVAGAGLLLAGGIVAGGALAGTLHTYSNQPHPALGSLLYLGWALGQEFILQSFFFVRLEKILRSGRKAVWAASQFFFLAHLPNPVLLIVAAFAGPLLCELFRRYRNIYPLALGHALVGLALAAAIPDLIHHQMKVGMAYFHWL